MSFPRSIFTISSLTLVSRFFGFIRDVLIASILGAGLLADVFLVAFKFPNLFRRLFAEGGFNAAFVPYYSKLTKERDYFAAKVFAEQAFSLLLWALLLFVIVIEIIMPWALMVFVPGFVGSPKRFDLAVSLTRITLPYLVFISLVALASGILNTIGKFAAAAATPILLNLSLISSVLWLASYTDTPAHALAWGVALAGVLQLSWILFWLARSGIILIPRLPKITSDIKVLARKFFPAVLGTGVYQISILIDTVFASTLPAGSISYLFFADRINQLPMGVIGVAVGIAILPVLSRQLAAEQHEAAIYSQNRAIEFSMFFTIPSAMAIIILSEPIISTLFQRGAFDVAQTIATSDSLKIYALGLPAYVLIKVLSPNFFARGDTLTPTKIGVLSISANIVLNFVFIGAFQHLGIAAATAISAWINAVLLYLVLVFRRHVHMDSRLLKRFMRILFSGTIMGGCLYLCSEAFWTGVFSDQGIRIIVLLLLVGIGFILFVGTAILSYGLKISELREVFSMSNKSGN